MIRRSDEVAGNSPDPKRQEVGEDDESLPGLPNFPSLQIGLGVASSSSSSNLQGMNVMIEGFQQMMLMQQKIFQEQLNLLKETRQSMDPLLLEKNPVFRAPPGLEAVVLPKTEATSAKSGEEPQEEMKDCVEEDLTPYISAQGPRRISASVVSKITSATMRLRKRLHALHRSEEHVQKLTGQLEELRKGFVPNGQKPFKLPWSSEIWLEKGGDLPGLVISADENDTLEFLKHKLHIEHMASSIILDKRAEELRAERLRQDSSLAAFVAECGAFAEEEYAMLKKTLSGTGAPKDLLTNLVNETKTLAITSFRKIVEKLALENQKQEEIRSRQQQKEKDALEAAAKLPAEEVVRRGLQEMCKKRLGKKFEYDKMPQVVEFGKLLKIDVDPLSTQTFENAQKPKNGVSPAVGQGHNQKGKKGSHHKKGQGRKGSDYQNPMNQKWTLPGKGKGKGQSGAGAKGLGKGPKPGDVARKSYTGTWVRNTW